MENVQTDAVRFISNSKGRTDIEEEMKKLCLEPFDLRMKSRRISLLLKILSKEEQHPTLSAAYDDFLDQRTTSTVHSVSGFRISQISESEQEWISLQFSPKKNRRYEDQH